jgi:hypothetical protein
VAEHDSPVAEVCLVCCLLGPVVAAGKAPVEGVAHAADSSAEVQDLEIADAEVHGRVESAVEIHDPEVGH